MKLLVILGVLIAIVLVCDKYEHRLPVPIKQIFELWKKFSHILGLIMNFIILTILWIVGFGMYAIIIKIITFPKKFASKPNSYWIESEPTSVESMQYQF